mmetsp:Transcript_45503/g.90130  ORF Transcript_45503/g.90130 Transcript_45503/m.90130 type:complete len:317 (-) Transcript_45503:18-968(-)
MAPIVSIVSSGAASTDEDGHNAATTVMHELDGLAGMDPGAASNNPSVQLDELDEPPSCPDEVSALQGRIRPLDIGPVVAELGEEESGALRQASNDRDGGWNGPVAIERSDRCWNGPVAIERSDGPSRRPRPPLTGPRSLAVSSSLSGVRELQRSPEAMAASSGCGLEGARHCLRAAMQAIESCDFQVRGHMEAQRDHDEDVSPASLSALTAELAEARNEASQLRREVQRLRGMPEDLSALSTGGLHTLQQELSTALRNVHGELESRTKCCVCREAERQVLLRPCQHFALCSDCASRLSKCPLCRSNVECYETICVS